MGELDLSKLGLGLLVDEDQLDFNAYLDIFNIPSRSVLSVDFTGNRLECKLHSAIAFSGRTLTPKLFPHTFCLPFHGYSR
jgi:hypothetical protein